MALAHIIYEPEKPKRKPATKEEYESALEAGLQNMKEYMKNSIADYNAMIHLYNKYLSDKSNFLINYFKEDSSFTYTRHKRNKPGFEIPGVKR